MTVPYQGKLPVTFSSIEWFRAVVFRWRGSVFKLLYCELIIIVAVWYTISLTIEYTASDNTKDYLSDVVKFLRVYQGTTRTLLTFMLVYYYQQVYARAKDIFFNIPWPDNPFFVTCSYISGSEPEDQLLRTTIVRYILATTFIIYHSVSGKFSMCYEDPFENLVKLGLLTEAETDEIHQRHKQYPALSELSFVPLQWAQGVVRRAQKDKRIHPLGDDGGAGAGVYTYAVIKAITDYRMQCASLLFQVYLPFPVLLSQLVTLIVYIYIIVSLVAQQDSGDPSEPSLHFPFFTCLESLVFIGALRVGQIYTNPLGKDDDDYEIISFFNRNLRLAYVYGLYGNTNESAPRFDLYSAPPPLVSLNQVQVRCRQHVPIDFYSFKERDHGVQFRPGETSYPSVEQSGSPIMTSKRAMSDAAVPMLGGLRTNSINEA